MQDNDEFSGGNAIGAIRRDPGARRVGKDSTILRRQGGVVWSGGFICELSAGVHRSEVSLCHPVVPVLDSLAMVIRDELLYQTADETPRCVIVRMPTPPSAETLPARMRHRATRLAHS